MMIGRNSNCVIWSMCGWQQGQVGQRFTSCNSLW